MKFKQVVLSILIITSLVTAACSKIKVDQVNPENGQTQNPGDGTSDGNKDPDKSSDGGKSPITNPPQIEDTCQPNAGTFDIKSVVLNQGEAFTKSLSAIIHSNKDQLEIAKIKVSDNENCKCGTWEPYVDQKAWTLKNTNNLNVLSVQYKDFEGQISKCKKLSITHDDLPPVVSATLDPANLYQEPANTKLLFNSQDSGSGIKSVSCLLNSSPINCSAGPSAYLATSQKSGVYRFEISAVDNLGFTASTFVSWTVTTPYKNVSQNYEVKSNNKVDILIIDDNSGSMEYEQKSMAKRMSTFLNVLKGLDWRIGITTTDPDSKTLGDGRLIQTEGPIKQWFISSSMEQEKARTALEQTIQRKEMGSSEEQGIRATYRSIERSLDSADPNSTFYRNDAHFAAVVISDEDESDTKEKNIPENLLAFVNKLWPQKNFAFHSIITKPGDTACKNDQGYAYGNTYAKMSALTGNGMIGGAIIGSVCESDYGSQLSGIGNSVQAMQKIIELDCQPIGSVNSSVIVSLNGSNYTDAYEVQSSRMVFKNTLPAGKYLLEYKCAK